MCVSSAEHTIPVKNARKSIPCWNEDIKPLKETADFRGGFGKTVVGQPMVLWLTFSADAGGIIISPSGLRNRGMNGREHDVKLH